MKQKVEIAGIDVTAKVLKWEMERPYGDAMASLSMDVVRSISSLVTLTNGQTIEVWRSFGSSITDPDDKKFMGSIEKIDVQGGKITLSCKDELIKAQNKEVTKVYLITDGFAGKISAIFTDLMTTYAGMTADGTSVQDSGTVNVLQKFTCNHANVFERCQQLAKVLGWQSYYRADTGKVYFEPEGYTPNANTLTVGTEIVKVPKWENDSTALFNSLTVIGAKQFTETTEFFNGDAGTVVFTLANTPESIKIWVGDADYALTANDYPHQDDANLLKGGVDLVTSTPDYIVDKINKKVTFTTAPLAHTNNIEVNYTYNVPIPLRLTSPASIATYDQRDSTTTIMDVRDLDDAYVRGSTSLANSSKPKVYTELRVKKHDALALQVGQLVHIVDAVNVVDGTFLVNRYVFRYPIDYDILYVGPKEWRLIDQQTDILNRIKSLEEEQFRDSDAVVNLVQSQSDAELVPYSMTIYSTNICDSFILGHPDDNGKLGRGAIIDEFEATPPVWAATNATVSRSSDQAIVGTYSMKVIPSATAVTLLDTTAHGDLSAYLTDDGFGNMTGVVGLWIYLGAVADVTAIVLRIGSSSGDYAEITGKVVGQAALTFTVVGWNYVIFRLSTGAITGTPDWASVDYMRLVATFSAGLATVYMDYLTCGDGDKIALNGLGSREMQTVVYDVTY